MRKPLITTMHMLVLFPLLMIVLILVLERVDGYRYENGELGNSLLYAALYFFALLAGFVGWILSFVVILKERKTKGKHFFYAALYFVLGIGGFSWAYYLMQAS